MANAYQKLWQSPEEINRRMDYMPREFFAGANDDDGKRRTRLRISLFWGFLPIFL
ncbi:MAG: hypothetical protein ACREAC_00020 [Blastocatellia bacterium]